jgi:hypothetical protein
MSDFILDAMLSMLPDTTPNEPAEILLKLFRSRMFTLAEIKQHLPALEAARLRNPMTGRYEVLKELKR